MYSVSKRPKNISSNYSNPMTKKNLIPVSEENLCGDEKGNDHSIELPQRGRKSVHAHTQTKTNVYNSMMVGTTVNTSYVSFCSLSRDEHIDRCR